MRSSRRLLTVITTTTAFYVTMTLTLILTFLATGVKPECRVEDEQCEFWLEVDHRLTMMSGKDAVFPHAGKLFRYDVNTTEARMTQAVDSNHVIVADGWEVQKLVVVANGTMPGPSIEVYEGQTVVVHVSNRLTSSDVTIHWHGLQQRGTPWMDGVAFVTQCPIQPGQSFTYRFKAEPKGTYWYHSHIGSQLMMGLFGALIVREKAAPAEVEMKEHIMLIQDWNHDWDSDTVHMRMKYGSFRNRRLIPFTASLDGALFGHFVFQSGLINGRGRFYNNSQTSNMTPLTEYLVERGSSYRFRVIGAASTYPFRVSVDGHDLTLVASDGFELEPHEFESFVIQPGERFDFLLHANNSVGSYWVRAETLEVNVVNHIALAILRYNGASDHEPTSSRKTCTYYDTCLVANCPFRLFPQDSHTECLNFDELKADQQYEAPGWSGDVASGDDVTDIFLNAAFPGPTHPSAINGVAYKIPNAPALHQSSDISTLCQSELVCEEQKTCLCTFSISLEHNRVYQLVMSSLGNGKGFSHPMHLHGHAFSLVKLGFPVYNHTTGAIIADNPDIDCGGNVTDPADSLCNRPSWANSTWGGNSVPGLRLESPPLKDTVLVPTGGYSVVRFRADNPGMWFLHCHMDLHSVAGMALVLNESFGSQPAPPRGFPTCGDFRYDLPTK